VDLESPRVRELVALLRDRRTVVDPTLVVLERVFTGVPGQIAPGQRRQVERMPPALQRRHTAARVVVPEEQRSDYRAAWARMLALVARLHAEGVTLVIGSDSTAGLMLHRELELFVEAGLVPGDVLAMATLGNARALRLDREIGSIAPGKRADLVVVDGDPLADISTIRHVTSTMRAGVVYPSGPLYLSVGVAP
jgi:imidazolonepropionase-like amidohydrolase